MKSRYYTTEPYQRLIVAVRTRDYPLTNRIIEEQLVRTTGSEKAFWLIVRVGKWGIISSNAKRNGRWDDLDEALRVAPNDREMRETVLYTALGIAVTTEKLDRLVAIVKRVRTDLPHLKNDWRYWLHVGDLHSLKGHWGQALAAHSLAVERFHRQTSEAFGLFRGFLPILYCRSAVSAVAVGQPEQAARNLETAERLCAQLSEAAQNLLAMAMAIATAQLALYHGQWPKARVHLQAGVAKSGWNLHLSSDPTLIQVDLLAARIARAEGNLAGFRNFADRALARAEHHDLPMSVAVIRRVMAGAER